MKKIFYCVAIGTFAVLCVPVVHAQSPFQSEVPGQVVTPLSSPGSVTIPVQGPGSVTAPVQSPGSVQANVTQPTQLFAPPGGQANTTICNFLTSLLNIVTEIGAILGVLFLIWSGFRFIAAQGNEKKLEDAKRAFWYTILGITLLLSASVVARLVVVTVSNVISGSTSTANAQNSTPGANEFICSTPS